VRNSLLGLPITDIDISTNARPDEIISLAKKAGLKSIPTGINHGTITIISNNKTFEVTSFRKDIKTDGRHATVAYSDKIEDDAERRDFTINAIYMTTDGIIIDPLNGMKDLKKRHVRFIKDPNKRIIEDYLRILRFFRFTAEYGDPNLGIDAEGLSACAANIDGIAMLAKERVGSEIRKILKTQNPSSVLAAMEISGILSNILPGTACKNMPILIHLENKNTINWITRLIVLGGADPTNSLRLSNKENKEYKSTLKAINMGEKPSAISFKFGEIIAYSYSLAIAALTETSPPNDLSDQIAKGSSVKFPIKPQDLHNLEGKQLGDMLKKLKTIWIKSDFTLTNKDLMKKIDQ
jgi:poly(A) polymerase